jgi:hypothetical protein
MPPVANNRKLSQAFYAWERQGRGWALWNYPVELEPSFEPFTISRLSSALHAPLSNDEAPASRYPASDPVELRLGSHSKSLNDALDQILVDDLAYPVSFELLSLEGDVHVQLAYSEAEVAPSLPSLLELDFSKTKQGLQERWEKSPGSTVVMQFGLADEFMVPIRMIDSFSMRPLQAVVEALGHTRTNEMAIFQVLFQPVRRPWSDSIRQVLRLNEDSPYVLHAPRLLSEAREKIRYPLFAVVVRVAARAVADNRASELVTNLKQALQGYAGHGTNTLMPMEPIGYPEGIDIEDMLSRTTHRSGMILNRQELLGLIQMPMVSEEESEVFQHKTRESTDSQQKENRRAQRLERHKRQVPVVEDRSESHAFDPADEDVQLEVKPVQVSPPSLPVQSRESSRQHTYLRELITRLASSAGWILDETELVSTGPGSLCLRFKQNEKQVGCLVSITSTLAEELTHVKTCLATDLSKVVVIVTEAKRITELERGFDTYLDMNDRNRVQVLTVEGLLTFFDESTPAQTTTTTSTVQIEKGADYTVEVRYPTNQETDSRREAVSEILAGALKRMKKT